MMRGNDGNDVMSGPGCLGSAIAAKFICEYIESLSSIMARSIILMPKTSF